MIRRILTFTIVALIATSFSFGETVESIYKNMYEKYGNNKDIKTIKITVKGNVMGMDMPMVIFNKMPNKKRTEMEVMGSKMITGDNGQKGWVISPMAGSTTPQELPEDQYKASKSQNDFTKNPMDAMKEAGYDAKLEGNETLEGKDCFKIHLTSKDNPEVYMFIAKDNYMIHCMRAKGPMGDVDTYMTDYRKESGFMMPHKIETKGQMSMVLEFEKVEVNIPMDDQMFEMPK